MCGIVGIIDTHPCSEEDVRRVKSAMSMMSHRGPDDSGIKKTNLGILGHLRLSIIDLEGGHQPMSNEDGLVWVTYNGEIYNFQEIRSKLVKLGYRFKTNSDTEVLLKSYLEFGPLCINQFNGMFAFAIVDIKKKITILARDRLGIKPLYYFLEGNRLFFASELKAFKVLLKHKLQINHSALDCYLTYRYVIGENTLIKDVYKLQPGYNLIWHNGKVNLNQYWDIQNNRVFNHTYDQAKEYLNYLINDSVKIRMISDVPLGVMLSGGVDSSIITSIVSKFAGKGVKTFAIATDGGRDLDERPYAKQVAKVFGTDHCEIVIDCETYAKSLEKFAWQIDDLVADPASILLSYISKRARQDVTVALSGEGSDELFAGYSYYLYWKPWFRQNIFNKLSPDLLPVLGQIGRHSTRINGYIKRYRYSQAEFMCDYRGVAGRGLTELDRKKVIHSSLATFYGGTNKDFTWPIYKKYVNEELIDSCLFADCKTWLPDNLLTKADRMSMVHSLELRVPFLDHRLVEYASSLPVDYKVRQNGKKDFITKVLLKDTFRESLPENIINRKKQGFTLNWQYIVATEGKKYAQDILLSGRLDDIFERNKIYSFIDDVDSENVYSCQALLSLLLFGYWYDKMIN